MKTARADFIRVSDETAAIAKSLSGLIAFGTVFAKRHIGEYPEVGLLIGVGPPQTATIVAGEISIAEMLATNESHRAAVIEFAHAGLIHQWHLFLREVYSQMLTGHVLGEKRRPGLGKLQLRLDFEQADNILTLVVESAIRQFDFLESK